MKKQKLPPFVPLFINMMDLPAWLEMSLGARVLYLAFKKRYNRKTQQAVFLSVAHCGEGAGSKQRHSQPLVSRTATLRIYHAGAGRLLWAR